MVVKMLMIYKFMQLLMFRLIDFHFTEYIIRCCYRTYLLSPMMFKSRYCPSFGVIDLPIILMCLSFVLMTCKCCNNLKLYFN